MFIHSRLIPAVYTRTCNMYMQNVRKNTPKTLRAYSFRQEEYNVGPKINSFHLIKNTEVALQKKKKNVEYEGHFHPVCPPKIQSKYRLTLRQNKILIQHR